MLLLRPDLVDPGYQRLPPARYPMLQRLRPNYPMRDGGQGYVGDPPAPTSPSRRRPSRSWWPRPPSWPRRLIDGRLHARHLRSPFRLVPFLRTDFWPVAGAVLAAGLGSLWLSRSRRAAASGRASAPAGSADPAAEKGAPPR